MRLRLPGCSRRSRARLRRNPSGNHQEAEDEAVRPRRLPSLSRPTMERWPRRGGVEAPFAASGVKQGLFGLFTVPKSPIVRTVHQAGALNIMAKQHLKLVAPATVNRTVAMPLRRPN